VLWLASRTGSPPRRSAGRRRGPAARRPPGSRPRPASSFRDDGDIRGPPRRGAGALDGGGAVLALTAFAAGHDALRGLYPPLPRTDDRRRPT
jgi:hypothetical protein